MRMVYSHASGTIAATAAADSDEGLFFDRDPGNMRPRRLTATWSSTSEPSQFPEFDMVNPPAGLYWCDSEVVRISTVQTAQADSTTGVSCSRAIYWLSLVGIC
jgi:hypothetical protein